MSARTTHDLAALCPNGSARELAALSPDPKAPLSEIQEWMAKLLVHPRGLNQDDEMRAAAAVHFAGNSRLSPAEQINIYRQQFWLRHTSTLIDDFPGVSRILGQKEWERVAESYLSEPDHQCFALRHVGSQLAQHLENMTNLRHQELLVDMAKLEWAYEEAFDVINDPALSPEKLATIPADAWSHARIQLSHSLHLLQVRYPVARLRRQLKSNEFSFDREQEFPREAQNLVVYRRDNCLWDKAISTPAFLLLEQFQRGIPLVSACEQVVHRDPSAEAVFDEELTSWFSLWGRLGWICDVIVD